MTEQQAKRRDELAEAWSSKARMFKVGDDLFAHAFQDGYSACAKDAEVLVLILERIAWLEHYEPESATPSLLAGMAREALAKWRGE